MNNTDDQKRTVNIEEAFESGADYIVVGRPIKKVPDRRAGAMNCALTIYKSFLYTLYFL